MEERMVITKRVAKRLSRHMAKGMVYGVAPTQKDGNRLGLRKRQQLAQIPDILPEVRRVIGLQFKVEDTRSRAEQAASSVWAEKMLNYAVDGRNSTAVGNDGSMTSLVDDSSDTIGR